AIQGDCAVSPTIVSPAGDRTTGHELFAWTITVKHPHPKVHIIVRMPNQLAPLSITPRSGSGHKIRLTLYFLA
ncbi:hypothetical protein, partial [Chthoniobacter flavus]|uniref:hypothetical protein n=1 Tax=Chthoniobacter flavus TaxID=191863 RepID=UPI001A9DF357